jgi:hypothetical protein
LFEGATVQVVRGSVRLAAATTLCDLRTARQKWGSVFNTYRFDHPETDASQTLDARSYLWASLFGPLYVLRLGFPVLALLILPISVAITLVAFFGFGLVDWALGSELVTVGALFAVPVVALVAQGIIVIELLRRAYLRAGWQEGY